MNYNIPFHKPYKLDEALPLINEAISNNHIIGDQKFSLECEEILKKQTQVLDVKLATSCTHALEMAALLTEIKAGDEVILPSFTFSSTATAFLLRGAHLKFIDVEKETLNINAALVENAITDKTKVILPVHYAGISCDMDPIMDLAKKNGLYVIEDAAQSLGNTYKKRMCGAIGDLGCYSFHGTKNVTAGEGGALLVNNREFLERVDIIRQKGTNRAAFFKGEVDKYGWVDLGSSYTPSDILSALLLSQLKIQDEITAKRKKAFKRYMEKMRPLEEDGHLSLPSVPSYTDTNGHIFYFLLAEKYSRDDLLKYLKSYGIGASFHFQALHKSEAGKKYGSFVGEDVNTSYATDFIVRLPIFADIKDNEIDYITSVLNDFFKRNLRQTS